MNTKPQNHFTRTTNPILRSIPPTLLFLWLLSGVASAQSPWQFIPLRANSVNIVGATVVGLTVPLISSPNTSSVTWNGTDTEITDVGTPFVWLSFAKTLFPNWRFTIEFQDGAWGIISSCTPNQVKVSGDITNLFCLTETYIIRKTLTLGDLYGLQPGNSWVAADAVALPNGSGGFDVYYFHSTLGHWVSPTTGFANRNDQPIYFVQGFAIWNRAATSKTVLLLGNGTKTTPTIIDTTSLLVSLGIGPGHFSVISSIYASAPTLSSSGLKVGNLPHPCLSPAPPIGNVGASAAIFPDVNTDVVWLVDPIDPSGFFKAFVNNSGLWKDFGAPFGPGLGATPLTTGFLIEHSASNPGFNLLLVP